MLRELWLPSFLGVEFLSSSRRQIIRQLLLAGVLPAVGAVLLFSAVAKGWYLTLSGMPKGHFLEGEGYYTLLVVSEFAFGLWLFSMLYAQVSRMLAIGVFAIFLEVALWQAFNGVKSCGCLGEITVNPWWMVLVDTAVLSALWFLGRDHRARTIKTNPKTALACLLMFFAVGWPAFVTMTQFQLVKTGSRPLRSDRFLHSAQIVVAIPEPTAERLLAFSTERLGVTLDLDSSVAREFSQCQPVWGRFNNKRRSGWVLLEAISDGMPIQSRWIRTDTGYLLLADNPLQRAKWYWFAGLAVGVLGFSWLGLQSWTPEEHSPSEG